MAGALRYIALINAVLLSLAVTFIFVPAPTYTLWLLAVVASELAPLLLLVSLAQAAAAFAGLRRRRHPKIYLCTIFLAGFAAFGSAVQTSSALDFATKEGCKLSLVDCIFFAGPEKSLAARLEPKEYANLDERPLPLDVYQPREPAAEHGALLVVHGGSWRSGHRSDFALYDLWLAGLGYTVFDLDYRLADGSVHFPAPVEDLAKAIVWIEQHAREYGVDKKRIALIGRSAGAQLALVAAYRPRQAGQCQVRCVLDLYGPTDMLWDYENPIQPDIIHSRQVIENYLGGKPDELKALYGQASACALVSPATPPTLLIYGGRDQIVSHLNADRLGARLMEQKIQFKYLYMPWANHGFDWNFSGLSSQISRLAVERFLHDNL